MLSFDRFVLILTGGGVNFSSVVLALDRFVLEFDRFLLIFGVPSCILIGRCSRLLDSSCDLVRRSKTERETDQNSARTDQKLT